MSWPKTNNLARLQNRVWTVALLAVVTTTSVARMSTAQTMQKGISVEVAPTSSAVPAPDADNYDALIITVTDTGKLDFGIDPVTPDSLAAQIKVRHSRTQNLDIKAGAR